MAGNSESASREREERIVMYAVQPLLSCPHLEQVRQLPELITASAPCIQCSSNTEGWLCLTCYNVNCGRYVSGHAVEHNMQSGHSMVLSMSDISVWCYACEAYVHNEILLPAKNALHYSKFGENLPHATEVQTTH